MLVNLRLDDAGIVVKGTWTLRLLNRDGSPLKEPSTVDIFFKDFCDGIFTEAFRIKGCGFCLFNLGDENHRHTECPLFLSFNKMRKNGNMLPITVAENHFVTSAKNIPLTLELVKKQFDQEIRDLKAKLGEHLPLH
jgi:hypothetical protein